MQLTIWTMRLSIILKYIKFIFHCQTAMIYLNLLVGKISSRLHSVLFELQIEYKCARVVRVCIHVPLSPPSAAITEKKRSRLTVTGTTEKWMQHRNESFPVYFCSFSPHYTLVSLFDYQQLTSIV